MEIVKEYLSNATIHGLSHIASTKGLAQTVWFCVVSVCVAYAGISIGQSFESWSKNKITTTIETLPITEVPFPKVTVCPPKNTFTNLNYDLMTTINVTLNTSTQDTLIKDLIKKVIEWKTLKDEKYLFHEEDKARNRYLGMSKEKIIDKVTGTTWPKPYIFTSVSNGSISTPGYGELFDFDLFNQFNTGCKEKRHGYYIYLVFDQFNLTNSILELNVKIEHNLHHSQIIEVDSQKQNIDMNPLELNFSIKQRRDSRNHKVNCIHVSLYGQTCQKNENKLEIFVSCPNDIGEKEKDIMRSKTMTGVKVSWKFSGNGTFFQTKSSLIETDENSIKLTNILKMKTRDKVWDIFEDINIEYKSRSLFGGSNCRVSECNSYKIETLQRNLNISEVSSTSNLTNTNKEILEASLEFSRIMQLKVSTKSDLWIKAFDKAVRQAPNLNHLIRRISNMMPVTNIYRQMMFDVLWDNLDMTFNSLQQLSLIDTFASYSELGKK